MRCCVVCVRACLFAVIVAAVGFAMFVLSVFVGVTCSDGF